MEQEGKLEVFAPAQEDESMRSSMFQTVKLTLLSPDKRKSITAGVSAILTVAQVLQELERGGFIHPRDDYVLLMEEYGRVLVNGQTLSGLGQKLTLRVVQLGSVKSSQKDSIAVTFIHPTSGTTMEVELDPRMTVRSVICELIASSFIPDVDDRDRYLLFVKSSQLELSGEMSLENSSVEDGDVLRIVCRVSG